MRLKCLAPYPIIWNTDSKRRHNLKVCFIIAHKKVLCLTAFDICTTRGHSLSVKPFGLEGYYTHIHL